MRSQPLKPVTGCNVTKSCWGIDQQRLLSGLPQMTLKVALVSLSSVGIGLVVIVATHLVDNPKLLVGVLGVIAFVLLTMQWPEFSILCYVALLSGLISLTWLPLLPLGPVSLHISDFMLMLLVGLTALRATSRPGFRLVGSPLLLPLFLFVGAYLLSAVNAILIYGVGPNTVLRTVRVLSEWLIFVPILELVRDEQALRRLLVGLLGLTGILLIGVLFPNKFEPFVPVQVSAAQTGSQLYEGFSRFYYPGDIILYFMIPVTVASLAIVDKGKQIWRVGLLGLLLYWVVKTFFRQYWLTLSCTCALLVVTFSSVERVRLLRRVAPVMIGCMLILIVLIAVNPAWVEDVTYPVVDRVTSLARNPLKRESSLQWRAIETRYALLQIGRHPLLGLGLGNSYRPPMVLESETTDFSDWTGRYVENGYLWIAVMMGLVGLLPFLWLCAAHLLRLIRHYPEIQDDSLRATYLGYGAAFLGMVVCNIATPTFVIGTRLIFFPVAMAISEVILRLEREKGGHQWLPSA